VQTLNRIASGPRPLGLSAFVRCRNEQEFIVASLMSIYRVCDEIVVILNNSTDGTKHIVTTLAKDRKKLNIIEYPYECSAIGPGYHDRATTVPTSSLAKYYNWCVEATTFSHVCKWDGDMVATPAIEQIRELIAGEDVIAFDGHDVLGRDTTNNEPRIFRYNPRRARYIDWDLYEILQHDYPTVHSLGQKCYLHFKLVKQEWLGKEWSNPNLLATRPAPDTGQPIRTRPARFRSQVAQLGSLLRNLW
jgi:hypothetical protein